MCGPWQGHGSLGLMKHFMGSFEIADRDLLLNHSLVIILSDLLDGILSNIQGLLLYRPPMRNKYPYLKGVD